MGDQGNAEEIMLQLRKLQSQNLSLFEREDLREPSVGGDRRFICN